MGFTKVDNNILKQLPELNGRELKVLLVIEQRTKAWNQYFAKIDPNTFSKITGIRQDNCERTIKALVKREKVFRFKGRTGWLYFNNKKYLNEFIRCGFNNKKMFKPFE